MCKLNAVATCILCISTFSIIAGEDAKPEASIVAAEYSIASLDSVAKQLADIGVPVPALLQASVIDSRFPFVGKVDPTRPCSFSMLIREGLSQAKRVYFSLPSKDTSSFLKTVKAAGAKPVVDGREIYEIRGVPVRFDNARVLFWGGKEALQLANDSSMLNRYTDKRVLGALWFDLSEARKNQPAALSAFIDEINTKSEGDGPEEEDKARGRKLVAQYAKETLDRFEISVLRNADDEMELKTLVNPCPPLAGVAALPKPVMPPDCISRVDLCVTAPQKKDLETLIQKLDGTAIDPESSLIAEIIAVHWGGNASSIGWTVKDGSTVVYLVRQASEDHDLAVELQEEAKKFEKMSAAHGGKSGCRIEEYSTASGLKVWREALGNGGMPSVWVDFLQKDKRVYMTFSDSDKKFVEQMPIDQDIPGEQISKGIFAEVSVPKLLDYLQEKSLLPVPPSLMAAAANIKMPVKLKCTLAADGLHADLSVPLALIKAVIHVAAQLEH